MMKQWLRGRAADEHGTVAVIFSFAAAMLVMFCGVAIDTGRAMGSASKVSAILDSTALATSRAMVEQELSASAAQAYALDLFHRSVVAAGIAGPDMATPTVTADPATGSVTVTVNFAVPTTFAQLAGIDRIALNRDSTAVQNLKRVELALVLDVTGSMNTDGKLADLKDAATDLIDIMLPANKPPLNRIGLAPYSAAVNAGAYAGLVSGGASTDGCVFERDGANAATEASPLSGASFGTSALLGSPPSNDHYICPPATVLPMTSNANALKSTIQDYAADGWTAGHIGLAWGWYLLSPEWNGIWPAASVGRAYDQAKTVKAVILMTDGDFNTSYQNGDANAESANQTTALCDNMKADDKGIIIFSVAFKAPAAAEALLRSCASSDAHYFNADDGETLRTAFRDIAERLTSLRLSQ